MNSNNNNLTEPRSGAICLSTSLRRRRRANSGNHVIREAVPDLRSGTMSAAIRAKVVDHFLSLPPIANALAHDLQALRGEGRAVKPNRR